MSLHKELMDLAYNEYQLHNKWSLKDFYFNLEPLTKKAVALGNLNYQVRNGGFRQWIDNGYAIASKDTIHYIVKELTTIKGCSQLKKGLNLTLKALSFDINKIEHPEFDTEEYNKYQDEIEYLQKKLDKLDIEYYKLDNIEKEMEQYLIEIRK